MKPEDMHVDEEYNSEETGATNYKPSLSAHPEFAQALTGTDEYLSLYDRFPAPPGYQWPAHIPAELWASLPCRAPTFDDLEMDNIYATSGLYAHCPPSLNPRLLDESQGFVPPELLEQWTLGPRGTLDADSATDLAQAEGASSLAPQNFSLLNSYLDLAEGVGPLSLRDFSLSENQAQAQDQTPEFEEGSSRFPLGDSRRQNLSSKGKSVDKGKGKAKQREEDPDA